MKIPEALQKDIDSRVHDHEVRIEKAKKDVADKKEALQRAAESLQEWETSLAEIKKFLKTIEAK